MPKTIYLTLPAKDLSKATRFYEAIGCTINPQFSGDEASCMTWSESLTFMLHTEKTFSEFTPKSVADARKTTEVTIGLPCGSRTDVDTIIAAAAKAGGKADVRKPTDMGWMYNRAFEDADGHIFEAIWLDPTGVPKE